MKNLLQAVVITGILAATIGAAAAGSLYSYNNLAAPYGLSTYQSTGSYPSYGGGQHTYSHGGSYYGGVDSHAPWWHLPKPPHRQRLWQLLIRRESLNNN
jgi:hypothetical protein